MLRARVRREPNRPRLVGAARLYPSRRERPSVRHDDSISMGERPTLVVRAAPRRAPPRGVARHRMARRDTQVAQLVASWEAEQRQREGAIQQRFLAQLQAESAEMLKQKEVRSS